MQLKDLERSEMCTQVKYVWDKKVFELDSCPDWARWAAVDEDGYACWYSHEPVLCSFGWANAISVKAKSIHIADNCPVLFSTANWTSSLIKRPKKPRKREPRHCCRDSKGRFVSRIQDATPELPQTQCLLAENHYDYGRCKLLEFSAREISDEYGNDMLQLRLLLKSKKRIVELVIDVRPESKEKGSLHHFVVLSNLDYVLFSALLRKDAEFDADLSAICPKLYVYGHAYLKDYVHEISFPAPSCWRIEREIAL